MRTKKIDLPNYGVLDVTLDKLHLDHLHHLVEKYEPDNAKQQWMLIDDDNRFQKEVIGPVVQEYIGEYGIPEKLLSTHIHDLTFQKFWANCDTNLVRFLCRPTRLSTSLRSSSSSRFTQEIQSLIDS